MKSYLGLILSALLLLVFQPAQGQDYDGFRGTSAYQRYDNTYINPDYRGKHSVSIGLGSANVSPLNAWAPKFGGHIGYNYLIMYKRKRIFGIKETIRDEIKMGFGAHLHIWNNSEWYLTFNYMNPLFAIRGKMLGFYFFSEYGIGFHRAPAKFEDPSKVRFNVSIEPLRIKFGKSPLNICATLFYDAGSALLSKDRMDLAAAVTLRYYIYRSKVYKKK